MSAERIPRLPTFGRASAELRRAAAARVLDRFAPAHVVVDRDGEILHFSPRTGRFLQIPRGAPTRQLAAFVRPDLRLALSEALRRAVSDARAVVRRNVATDAGGAARLTVTIEPLPQAVGEMLYLVVFTEDGAIVNGARGATGRDGEILDTLERELRGARRRLQLTIEEYDGALEELRAANEELLSANAEMQAATEEVELSREELAAMNAELVEANRALQEKIEELDCAYAELRGLFESSRLAAVFLDGELAIRDFTPAATRIFKLIPSDRGRPLSDIANRLDGVDLRAEIGRVLATRHAVERLIGDGEAGGRYLMQLLPYRAVGSAVEGVLAAFIDLAGIGDAREE